jgi:predicted GNAT superfamily acetyltransferase
LIVEWPIADERVARRVTGGSAGDASGDLPEGYRAAPVANVRGTAEGAGEPVVAEPPAAPVVRVEVPEDVQEVRRASPEAAALWRASTRRAFESLLERRYRVVGFYREPGLEQRPLKRPSSAPVLSEQSESNGSAGAGGRPGRGTHAFYVLCKEDDR